MPIVTINDIKVTPRSIGDIPDSLNNSGQAVSFEIAGYPPISYVGPWPVVIKEDDLTPLFTGHLTSVKSVRRGARFISTISAIDRSRHLARKSLWGTYSGELSAVIKQLIADAGAANWFAATYRTAPDIPFLLVKVYLQGQFLRKAIETVLAQSGVQAILRVLIDTGNLEIYQMGFGETAPLSTIDMDLPSHGCAKDGEIFDVSMHRYFYPYSVYTVIGRHGDINVEVQSG